ncbi:hypothetical protein EVAR_97280_1 [Eumeta japonica]|uniref:Uncharacterized protein n=1 Tax=Eumeta variegata TaxID=151549 RepID=A0A4C1XEH9_EUMVA|nr:hypothetical protein EVAR_97280_1 [Eumeta japonica]
MRPIYAICVDSSLIVSTGAAAGSACARLLSRFIMAERPISLKASPKEGKNRQGRGPGLSGGPCSCDKAGFCVPAGHLLSSADSARVLQPLDIINKAAGRTPLEEFRLAVEIGRSVGHSGACICFDVLSTLCAYGRF